MLAPKLDVEHRIKSGDRTAAGRRRELGAHSRQPRLAAAVIELGALKSER